MKNFFTLTLCFFTLSLTAQEPLTYPYNPDANGDTFVGVSDVLEGISTYDNFFFPEEIMVGDTTLSNWIQILNQTLANQQAVIDSLQASLDSFDSTPLNYDSIAEYLSIDSAFVSAMSNGLGSGGCSYAFPDGLKGEAVTIDLSTGYIVPVGKTLYIINYYCDSDYSNAPAIVIDENVIFTGLSNVPHPFDEFNSGLMLPIIVGSGEEVLSVGGGIVNCLIVDSTAQPLTERLDSSNYTYEVPEGKTLYITNIFSEQNPLFRIDDKTIFFGKSNCTWESYRKLSSPLIINSGEVFSIAPPYESSVISQYVSFNGYLVDEDYFADCGGGGGSSEVGSGGGMDVSIIGDTLTQNGISLIVPGISYKNTPDEIFSTVTDIDGNLYQTVDYGFACWMTENLYTTRYSNGDDIIYPALATEPSYNIDENALNGYFDHPNIYYNHLAVNDSRNVCPSGWHVPTIDEWEDVLSMFGEKVPTGNAYGFLWVSAAPALKSYEWGMPNWSGNEATNYSHLNIYRLGWMSATSFNLNNNNATHIYTSTVDNGTGNWNIELKYDNELSGDAIHISGDNDKFCGVRCVKD